MSFSSRLYRIASTFSRAISVYYAARSPGIFRWLQLARTESILDLGCGNGLWLSALAPRSGITIGLDLQEAFVKEAHTQLSHQEHKNAAFVVALATALPLQCDCFDKVLCVDVVDNISDDHTAASEVMRILKPGGRLVITALLKDRHHYLRPILFPEHLRNYTPDSLSTLLSTVGFLLKGMFYFYHPLSTLAWEIFFILHDRKVDRIPLVGTLFNILLSFLVRLDSGLNRPGAGIGLAADKPAREAASRA